MNTPQDHQKNKASKMMLHANPEKAMQQMMETIDHMRGIYEAETEALVKADSGAFASLQGDKEAAVINYKKGIEELISRKAEMRDVSPDLKRKLEVMQEDFYTLSQQNLKAIKRMQKTMDRLGNTIRSVTKEEVQKKRTFSYSPDGQLHKNRLKRITTGVSETA